MKRETVKITFNMSVELLQKVEAYADSLNINRTSAMSVLMNQALEQKKAMNMLEDLPKLLVELESKKSIRDSEK